MHHEFMEDLRNCVLTSDDKTKFIAKTQKFLDLFHNSREKNIKKDLVISYYEFVDKNFLTIKDFENKMKKLLYITFKKIEEFSEDIDLDYFRYNWRKMSKIPVYSKY